MTEEHWWHRLNDDVKEWLQQHHDEPLDVRAFDAVIGAGGAPIEQPPGGGDLPDGPLLSAEDWEYIKEQHPQP